MHLLHASPSYIFSNSQAYKLHVADTPCSWDKAKALTHRRQEVFEYSRSPLWRYYHNKHEYHHNINREICFITLPCRYNKGRWIEAEFYIVDSERPAIIGRKSSRELGLITLHCKINTEHYPEQFDRIGNFPGVYHIVLKDNPMPTMHAPRKCSIHIRDELKTKLN